jgi:hypothetical protein
VLEKWTSYKPTIYGSWRLADVEQIVRDLDKTMNGLVDLCLKVDESQRI